MTDWEDAPLWVHEAAKAERWRADEWLWWETVRERLGELRVSLEPHGDRLHMIEARGDLPFTFEPLEAGESRPLFEALDRLIRKVAQYRREHDA